MTTTTTMSCLLTSRMMVPPTSESWMSCSPTKLDWMWKSILTKFIEGHNHAEDLEVVLQSVRKYNMRLNPAKCSFIFQARKLSGFVLTKRDVEANPDKCLEIISMRSPTNGKEVLQLIGWLASLSRFFSCAGGKTFLFFDALNKNGKI